MNHLKLQQLVTGGLAFLVTTFSVSAEAPKTMQASLQQWLGDQPGGVAAVYVDAQGVTFANAGVFSASDPRPVTEDTQFEIGSVTKTFTALLLADSVDAGKVRLGDHVGAPFGESAITYEQLATHTSGLPRLPSDFSSSDPANPYLDQTVATLVRSFAATVPEAKATDAADYSNFGCTVLGQALAGMWGESYAALLQSRVLVRLGLPDTLVSWREADASRLAPGHSEQGPVGHWDLGAYAPAGSLVSTTRDLARLIKAYLGLVETPLTSELQATMQPRKAVAGAPGRRIGLAWMIEPDGIVWHNGATGGFHSVILMDPAKKAGVVVLTNHAQGVEALGKAVLKGEPLPAKKEPVAPAEALQGYLGNYPLAPSFVMAVTAEGETLYLQATNQPRLKLTRETADRFAVVGVEAAVSFERNAGGKVVALVLHQNGRDQRAPRLAPGEKPATRSEVSLPEEMMAAYPGRYRFGGVAFTVKRDGERLLVQLTGQPFAQVFASAPDEFFYRVVQAEISFVRGKDGQVEALVLHQNGADIRAERVVEPEAPKA